MTNIMQLHITQDSEETINFCTRFEYIDEREYTRFIFMRLTLDNNGDPYAIKYMYTDEEGNITSDATNMHIKSHNKPGLARYAVIDERCYNVKWVKKGECTWGIGVRDCLIIKQGEEILRPF